MTVVCYGIRVIKTIRTMNNVAYISRVSLTENNEMSRDSSLSNGFLVMTFGTSLLYPTVMIF